MSEDKTKEQLLSELIELKRRLFQYKLITKGARAINQQKTFSMKSWQVFDKRIVSDE